MVPVIAGDSIRKRTPRAMSAGVEERCSGVIWWAAANSAADIGPETSVMPGAMPHTRTRGARAWASITVAHCSAALESVYEK